MDPYATRPDAQPAQPPKSIDLQVLLGERPFLDTAVEGRPDPVRDEHPLTVEMKDRNRAAITQVRVRTMQSRRVWLEGLLRIGVGVQAGIWWYLIGSTRGFFSAAALLGALVGAGLYQVAVPLRWRADVTGLAALVGFIGVLFVSDRVRATDLFPLLFAMFAAAYMGGERKRAQVE